MTREIMNGSEIAYAEQVAAKRAAGRKPAAPSRMPRYERPWNAPTSPAPEVTPVRESFVQARPRADRLVYALLGELAELDNEAATVGRAWYDRNRETLTVKQGSDWITRLRVKIARSPGNAPVPADRNESAWDQWHRIAGELAALGGRYGARFAVDTEPDAVNRIAFWWISPGRDGRFWLRQVIGGSGPVRVRMSPAAMIAVANKIIAAGAVEAMHRYGRELGECGHCGRELTNDESRAIGIGPWCRTHN